MTEINIENIMASAKERAVQAPNTLIQVNLSDTEDFLVKYLPDKKAFECARRSRKN